jgi:hypothetical protein
MDAETRAAHARQLLDDPLLSEVLDSIEAAAINAWRTTNSSQQLEREVAWYSIKAAERVRTTLKGLVDDGLIEANRAVRLASSRP